MTIKEIYKAVSAYKKPLGITLSEVLVHIRTYHKKYKLVKRKLPFIESLHLTAKDGSVIDVVLQDLILPTCLKTPLNTLSCVRIKYKDGSEFKRDCNSTSHYRGQQHNDISYAILHILSDK